MNKIAKLVVAAAKKRDPVAHRPGGAGGGRGGGGGALPTPTYGGRMKTAWTKELKDAKNAYNTAVFHGTDQEKMQARARMARANLALGIINGSRSAEDWTGVGGGKG